MNEAIKQLEMMRRELQQRISAIDTALNILRQVDADLGETDQSLLFEEEQPQEFNKVVKNPPMDFSLIKDMNRGGGGIRSDI
jgi:hypothetical protein